MKISFTQKPTILKPEPEALKDKLERQQIIEKVAPKSPAFQIDLSNQSLTRGVFRGNQTKLSLNNSSFFVGQSQVITTQQKNSFSDKNQKLLTIIAQSEKASEIFQTKEIKSSEDLEGVISQAAYESLNQDTRFILKQDFLDEKQTLSQMILLNVGGITDKLNENEDLAKSFANSNHASTDDLFNRLATKASELFDENSALNDVAFFKEHKDAALYLLEQRSYAAQLNRDDDLAKKFKSKIDASPNQDFLDDFISTKASQIINSGTYDEAFFQDHKAVGEYVLASEEFNDLPKFSEFLLKNPQYGLENIATGDLFSSQQLIDEIISSQAKNLLDSKNPIDQAFLKNNEGFTKLLIDDKDFRSLLAKEEEAQKLNLIFSSQEKEKINQNINQHLDQFFQPQFNNLKQGFDTLV